MMKKFLSRYFPLIPVVAVLLPMMMPWSCANTTSAPSGGKKDTIPPVIVGINPLPGATGVPCHNAQISITFDEYITVKEAKNIFLSPPLEKAPKYRMRGKTLQIYFESDLDSNTTYTLDLTGAIADNNEGNMYPGYTLMFSTGERLDSMVVTGTVLDCSTLQPVKGATVMMYKDLADSAVFLHRPDAAVKTDDWGFFAIRNISDSDYRLYAIVDDAGDNIYDPESDKIAFIDSLIHPSIVVSDTLAELLKYDMKDTARCMARNSEYELLMFREKPSKQLIVNKKRNSMRSGYMTFMAPDAKIDSIWVRGIEPDRLITQFNILHDSLEFWINDRKRLADTLHMWVDYLKTDTLGRLVPFVEHLKIYEEDAKPYARRSTRDLKHEDTLCSLRLTANPETVEQYGFSFDFGYPLVNSGFDEVLLTRTNPRRQVDTMDFTITRDTLNLRRYTLTPSEDLQKGYDYKLIVPHRKFRDINGYYNDSTQVSVTLPNDDKLSKLTLDLSGVGHKYIVDLLNEKRDNTLRSYIIEEDCSLDFPYLKAGRYSIRITEDVNKNGFVDTGNLLAHQMPEKVRFYKLRDGTYVINIKEGTELSQKIDIGALFSK